MTPHLPNHRAARAAALGAACLLSLLAPPVSAGPDPVASPQSGEELSILASVGSGEAGVGVTLTFSRPAEYRLQESRHRLNLQLSEEVEETSFIDQQIDSRVVERLRFRKTRAGTEVLFYLGDQFETFSLTEREDPFRLVLTFRRQGAVVSPPEAPIAETPGPPGVDGSGIVHLDLGSQNRETAPPPPLDPLGPQPESRGLARVVIDPGHGGSEQGAIGPGGLMEKEVVLDIARRMRARLLELGYTAGLTREDDRSMDLTSRTALANHEGADLFISVHANASLRPEARGAETYFLSFEPSDEEALVVARGENLAHPPARAKGDEGRIEMVLWEMAHVEHLSRSSRLAEIIQEEMNQLAGTRNRGVKQAPFRVLVGAAMPAVLVEVGFLSNAQEEDRLAVEQYRERVAKALASAVHQYHQEVGRASDAMVSSGSPSP